MVDAVVVEICFRSVLEFVYALAGADAAVVGRLLVIVRYTVRLNDRTCCGDCTMR